MNKIISMLVVSSFMLLAACGGRTAEPVMIERHGDERKICKLLIYEIENLEFDIHQLLPKTDKRKQNIAYGVVGYFTFFIPWLLIDFKNAEAQEYKALRARHEHLAGIAKKKSCDIKPKYYPTVEEIKKDHETFTMGKDKGKTPEEILENSGSKSSQQNVIKDELERTVNVKK